MRTYETTILVSSSQANADYDGTLAAVKAIYESEGAEFIELEKWEERRLAYPIDGNLSAVYLVGYFKSDPLAVERIERRAQLSEVILRQLIIVRDGKEYDRIREQRAKVVTVQDED
jgi:small subunit ribosomal protein S6